VAHVVDAEAAYGRKLGVRAKPDPSDPAGLRAFRELLVEALTSADGEGEADAGKRWPAAYAARRIAWHVLDHAWEIEDRSAPAAAGDG
jgi:hypothetical protein